MAETHVMGGDELKAWLQGQGLVPTAKADSSWEEILADGIVLCQLANRLKPGVVPQVSFSLAVLPLLCTVAGDLFCISDRIDFSYYHAVYVWFPAFRWLRSEGVYRRFRTFLFSPHCLVPQMNYRVENESARLENVKCFLSACAQLNVNPRVSKVDLRWFPSGLC